MKKFIVAFDGLRFSESAMSYAIDFSKHCNAHLVGVFLDDFTRRSYSVTEIYQYEGEDFDQRMNVLDKQDEEERNEQVDRFLQACNKAGLSYSIHHDKNVALWELINESVYADLLIVDATETLTRYTEQAPTRFIKDLLNEVQCPVVLVPKKVRHIEKTILLYDGEPSSVFAARAFSYLFDVFKSKPTEILTIRKEDDDLQIPESTLIKEFIKRHYPTADFFTKKGDAEEEIVKCLLAEKRHAIVVLGAYRRSRLSRLFKPSMADYLLQHVDLPLFVAHNKS